MELGHLKNTLESLKCNCCNALKKVIYSSENLLDGKARELLYLFANEYP